MSSPQESYRPLPYPTDRRCPYISDMDADQRSGQAIYEQPVSVAANKMPETEKSWLHEHRVPLTIAGLAIAGVLSVGLSHNADNTLTDLKKNAVVGFAFPITESLAWGGAALMLGSAGSKIGNPLTVKKRLTDIRDQLNDNRLYRAGWAVGAAGAVGTSGVVAVGALDLLPVASWPIAASISATSIAISTIPFKPKSGNEGKDKS